MCSPNCDTHQTEFRELLHQNPWMIENKLVVPIEDKRTSDDKKEFKCDICRDFFNRKWSCNVKDNFKRHFFSFRVVKLGIRAYPWNFKKIEKKNEIFLQISTLKTKIEI